MTTFEQVRDIMVDALKCAADEVTLETNLADDLGVDSLDAMELIMALEDAFEISIPQEEAKGLKTVQQIVELVDKSR